MKQGIQHNKTTLNQFTLLTQPASGHKPPLLLKCIETKTPNVFMQAKQIHLKRKFSLRIFSHWTYRIEPDKNKPEKRIKSLT